MSKKCKVCEFGKPLEGGALSCIFNPPSPIAVPNHNRITGEVQLEIVSFFPSVSPDNLCGRFVESTKPTLAGV